MDVRDWPRKAAWVNGCEGLNFPAIARLFFGRGCDWCETICGLLGVRGLRRELGRLCESYNARRGTRVSLSDWLAFQVRIRGSKDPRLLRDRPSDGAASACGN